MHWIAHPYIFTCSPYAPGLQFKLISWDLAIVSHIPCAPPTASLPKMGRRWAAPCSSGGQTARSVSPGIVCGGQARGRPRCTGGRGESACTTNRGKNTVGQICIHIWPNERSHPSTQACVVTASEWRIDSNFGVARPWKSLTSLSTRSIIGAICPGSPGTRGGGRPVTYSKYAAVSSGVSSRNRLSTSVIDAKRPPASPKATKHWFRYLRRGRA